jgi:hypothetical protein
MLLTIHISPNGLIQQLRRIAKYYEIVLFTVLSRQLLNKIISSIVPELDEIVHEILCMEEVLEGENNIYYKDLAILADNRT